MPENLDLESDAILLLKMSADDEPAFTSHGAQAVFSFPAKEKQQRAMGFLNAELFAFEGGWLIVPSRWKGESRRWEDGRFLIGRFG